MQSVYFLSFLLAVSVCTTLAKPGWSRNSAQDNIEEKHSQNHQHGGASSEYRHKHLDPPVEHLEKDLDENENGLLDLKESLDLFDKQFEEADMNKDGKLNNFELKMLRYEVKDEMSKDDKMDNANSMLKR